MAGWKRLLIIERVPHGSTLCGNQISGDNHWLIPHRRAIFDWVYGATPHEGFSNCAYLARSRRIALARRRPPRAPKREAASATNVREKLAPTYRTLAEVREFLVTKHDLYAARGLVARGSRRPATASDALLLASYGGGGAAPTSAWRAIARRAPQAGRWRR